MENWVAFGCFVLLGIADAIFAVRLRIAPSRFLMAGNPKRPNGNRIYEEKRFQKAAFRLCAIYSAIFLLTAASVLLVRITDVLPNTVLSVAMYLHGAALTLTAFGTLAYLDCHCQAQEKVSAKSA